MEKNKKGEIGAVPIVSILVILLILLIVVIPTYTSAVDSAITLTCNDAILDTLNSSNNLCFNGTHMAVTESPDQTGISPTQEAVLLIVPFFLILGAVFLVGRKVGIIGNN